MLFCVVTCSCQLPHNFCQCLHINIIVYTFGLKSNPELICFKVPPNDLVLTKLLIGSYLLLREFFPDSSDVRSSLNMRTINLISHDLHTAINLNLSYFLCFDSTKLKKKGIGPHAFVGFLSSGIYCVI